METVTIPEIVERLQRLSTEKLAVVYDFVSYLFDREMEQTSVKTTSEAFLTMVAAESVLKRDWERPEEDLAWAGL